MSLNETGDVACFGTSWNSTLSHTGFAPDYTEQLLSVSKSIAADDPLKTWFIANEPGVSAINDRDGSGYPQLVVRTNIGSANGGTFNVAVILTPNLVP